MTILTIRDNNFCKTNSNELQILIFNIEFFSPPYFFSGFDQYFASINYKGSKKSDIP